MKYKKTPCKKRYRVKQEMDLDVVCVVLKSLSESLQKPGGLPLKVVLTDSPTDYRDRWLKMCSEALNIAISKLEEMGQ